MSIIVFARRALTVASILGLFSCTSDATGNGGSSGNSSSGGTPGATPGAGNGVTLGPDLTTLAGTENTFGCSAGYPIQTNATFPQPFYLSGASSCLVLTFLAPSGKSVGSGTAVSANIRVGAVTGKMRFVRMRILYNRTQTQKCCSLEEYGDPFTPGASTTTTVPLGFKMVEDPLPAADDLDSIAANDLVALEVLAPDVPIPGVWTKNGGPELGTASYMWLPSLSEQNAPAPSGQILQYQGSYSGFVPSFTFSFVED